MHGFMFYSKFLTFIRPMAKAGKHNWCFPCRSSQSEIKKYQVKKNMCQNKSRKTQQLVNDHTLPHFKKTASTSPTLTSVRETN